VIRAVLCSVGCAVLL